MGRIKEELWAPLVERRTRILIDAGLDPADAEEIALETSLELPYVITELTLSNLLSQVNARRSQDEWWSPVA